MNCSRHMSRPDPVAALVKTFGSKSGRAIGVCFTDKIFDSSRQSMSFGGIVSRVCIWLLRTSGAHPAGNLPMVQKAKTLVSGVLTEGERNSFGYLVHANICTSASCPLLDANTTEKQRTPPVVRDAVKSETDYRYETFVKRLASAFHRQRFKSAAQLTPIKKLKCSCTVFQMELRRRLRG